MKIISWNLLHRAGASLDDIERLVADERPDLLVMQEATREVIGLASRLGGHCEWTPLPGRHHGLAAWSGAGFLLAPAVLTLPPGLIVRRVCQILTRSDMTVANVHLSHGQLLNRRQLRRIFDMLPGRAAVLGDCNLIGPVLWSGFRDVGPRRSTHRAGTVLPLRLDRCFVRGLDCADARILAKGASDHHPIMVDLSAVPP